MRRMSNRWARLWIVTILVVFGLTAMRGQARLALEALTVPPNRLPEGCAMPPSDYIQLSANRVQGGLWAGLPITSNPWIGADRKIVAAVRDRVAAPSRLPDGPPLSGGELRRFRLQLAADVAEAYAGVYYDEANGSGSVVYAARFTRTPVPESTRGSRDALRIVHNDTVVVVSGSGPCFEAVAGYVKDYTSR